MDWYEPDVQALEAARKSRVPTPSPTVFYGSSTIRLWVDLPEDLRLPGALNLGFGGSTLEACVYFFDRLITPEKPGSLVLYAGDNDIGDGRLPQQVFEFFENLVKKMAGDLAEIPFGFISIKPSPARAELMPRMREANRLIEQYISERKNGYFINIFDAMLGPDQKPRQELFDESGLHMNRSGYQLWSKLLEPYRNRMFTRESHPIQPVALTFT